MSLAVQRRGRDDITLNVIETRRVTDASHQWS